MSLSLRSFAVAAVIVISGSMVADNALAGGCHSGGYSHGSRSYSHNNHNTNHRSPSHTATHPEFGFTYVTCGHGLRVNYVAFGSVAYRMGLQCDDVILALNSCPVRTGRDWCRELDKAMCHGGCVVLEVRKCSGPIEIMTVRFGAIIGGGQTPVIGAGGPPNGGPGNSGPGNGGQTPVIGVGGPEAGAQPQTEVLNAPAEQLPPAAPAEQIQPTVPVEEIQPTVPVEQIQTETPARSGKTGPNGNGGK